MNAFCRVPLLKSTRAWCNFTCISRPSRNVRSMDSSLKDASGQTAAPRMIHASMQFVVLCSSAWPISCSEMSTANSYVRLHAVLHESTVTCSGRWLNQVIAVADWPTWVSWVMRESSMKSADYSENLNRAKHYTCNSWYHSRFSSRHLKLKVEQLYKQKVNTPQTIAHRGEFHSEALLV